MEVERIDQSGGHETGFSGRRGWDRPRRLARPAGPDPPAPPPTAPRWLNPTKLAYLIGPVAFAVVLVLMRFDYVERVRWWERLTVFAAIAFVNAVVDRIYDAYP